MPIPYYTLFPVSSHPWHIIPISIRYYHVLFDCMVQAGGCLWKRKAFPKLFVLCYYWNNWMPMLQRTALLVGLFVVTPYIQSTELLFFANMVASWPQMSNSTGECILFGSWNNKTSVVYIISSYIGAVGPRFIPNPISWRDERDMARWIRRLVNKYNVLWSRFPTIQNKKRALKE